MKLYRNWIRKMTQTNKSQRPSKIPPASKYFENIFHSLKEMGQLASTMVGKSIPITDKLENTKYLFDKLGYLILCNWIWDRTVRHLTKRPHCRACSLRRVTDMSATHSQITLNITITSSISTFDFFKLLRNFSLNCKCFGFGVPFSSST